MVENTSQPTQSVAGLEANPISTPTANQITDTSTSSNRSASMVAGAIATISDETTATSAANQLKTAATTSTQIMDTSESSDQIPDPSTAANQMIDQSTVANQMVDSSAATNQILEQSAALQTEADIVSQRRATLAEAVSKILPGDIIQIVGQNIVIPGLFLFVLLCDNLLYMVYLYSRFYIFRCVDYRTVNRL